MDRIKTLRDAVRDIPDFPKPGILFKDITPILRDPALFRAAVDVYTDAVQGLQATRLAAVDARGFLFAGALAERLGLGLVPIRKKGKLPYHTYEASYELEYGSATLAVHRDAFEPADRVAVIDDLLATGGTAAATAALIEQTGATVAGFCFLIELDFLNGKDKLANYRVESAIHY
jgi:adenine phosphoribosyltransferase